MRVVVRPDVHLVTTEAASEFATSGAWALHRLKGRCASGAGEDDADRRHPLLSRCFGHPKRGFLLVPLIALNEADLNENDRACRSYCRKDMFAISFMPELVHR
jgi:hypothetical protein